MNPASFRSPKNQAVPNASKVRFWKKFAEELKGEEQSRKYAQRYQAKALSTLRKGGLRFE